MHHAKNRGNKVIPLAILSRILAQSCVTPPYIIKAKGLRMIVLVSLIVLLKGLPCFRHFTRGASHPYIPIHSMECFLHLFHVLFPHIPHIFDGSRKRSYALTRVEEIINARTGFSSS